MADAIPTIAFSNQLAYDVIVYDSFDNDDDSSGSGTATNGKPSAQAYFATLTRLGTVPAGATVSLQPIHDSSAFVVESASDSKPVKRMVAFSFDDVTALSIVKDDETAMTQTFGFVNFFLNNPNDPVSVAFNKVINATTDDLAGDIDAFFAGQPAYNKCGFEDYMMALAYTALHPPVPNPAQPPGTSSLKTISALMGSKWPDSLPDIYVTKFTCTTKDSNLILTVEIDISMLPFETDQIAKNVNSMYFNKKVKAQLRFNYAVGINIFGTRLTILLDTMKIPTSPSNTFAITKPSITVDIMPVFKFVVLTVRGIIPFNLFGKPFDANISMVIHNEEAEIGVVIEGDHSSLPAPPLMKGVHFDEFGVGMGVFFEPPGFALGLQGKLHIGELANPDAAKKLADADAAVAKAKKELDQYGDPPKLADIANYTNAKIAYQQALVIQTQAKAAAPNSVDITDDTFALVCKLDGDVPEPVYASFYVPKMDINQVVEIFTNASPNLNVPVTFTDLSFRWAENPMEPYILPDGTLSEMGYGFSAAVTVFSFGFFGDIEIDMNNGLTAHVEASPLHWGNIFSLSGDGKGVTIKVDAAGNPIKNNQIRDKKVLQDALKTATDKQLVNPGGPVLIINTLTSPILHVNARVSLFEISNYGINADINGDGILFQLDFGGILTEHMTCRLSDFHNFYGEFKFGIDRALTLPTIGGVHLGFIRLQATVGAHLSVKTSLSDIILSVGGSFDFAGLNRQFGDFNADIHIQKLTDLIEAVFGYIEQNAKQIFGDLLNDAERWAGEAKSTFIAGCDAVSVVLKNAYGKSAAEVASIMKGVGYAAEQVASEIKDTFNLGVHDVEAAMKAAGYVAGEVISALKNVFNIGEIASALKNVYGLSVNDINSFLQSAGYTADQVKGAFEALGGDFANFAKETWDKITNPDTWNPSKW